MRQCERKTQDMPALIESARDQFEAGVSVVVTTAEDGTPQTVDGHEVTLRNEWRAVDRWWTDEPQKRAYFVVGMPDGRERVLLFDEYGEWSDAEW